MEVFIEQKSYDEIKKILMTARNKVYKIANFAMVEAYWNIGKSIIEEQGGNEKVEYGTRLLNELSKQMIQVFCRGFSFVARQKRITFDGRHFTIDLVFYNYIFKCFNLIDLKVGDLTH